MSEPRARAHLGGCQRGPVVDSTAIAESQQSGAETQSHRPFEITLAFGRVRLAFEDRGIFRAAPRDRRPFGCSRARRAGCTRRTIHATTRPVMTRTIASHTYHGTKSIDVADPADHGIEAIAEPAQRPAERTRRGIVAEATIVEDRACVRARRVRVDCLRDASDHAGIASAARLASSRAIIICTSNASVRMRRSK